MKVNELRVGNWVLEFGHPLQISLNNGDLWHTDNFNGIPLTPEILEQCGFKRDKLGHWRKNMNKSKFFILRGREWHYKTGYLDTLSVMHYDNCKMSYLHQLQNIYFALIGEELEIKSLCPA